MVGTFKRGELPKRRKAKSGRNDLNLIALSLIVTRDRGIPIMHQIYAGKRRDRVENKIKANLSREAGKCLKVQVLGSNGALSIVSCLTAKCSR